MSSFLEQTLHSFPPDQPGIYTYSQTGMNVVGGSRLCWQMCVRIGVICQQLMVKLNKGRPIYTDQPPSF